MKKQLASSILTILLCFTLTCIITNAANGTAEIHWMTNISCGGSGIGPGGSAAIETSLKNIGYDAQRLQDTFAANVRQSMNSDNIFAIITHGANGYVICNDDTTISAKNVPEDTENYSLETYFDSNAFNLMKFAYYGACETARDDSMYGGLVSYSTNTLGAESALGFYGLISNQHASYFEENLFAELADGATINTAASAAKNATYNKFGSFGDVDTYLISGSPETTIR